MNQGPNVQSGNSQSEQAEASTANPAAANVQMRILISLQVIEMLLLNGSGTTAEDLRTLRQNVADSIT